MSARAAQFDDPMSRVDPRGTTIAPNDVEDEGDRFRSRGDIPAEGQVRVGAQVSGFEYPEEFGLIDPLLAEGLPAFPPGFMIDVPNGRVLIPTFF